MLSKPNKNKKSMQWILLSLPLLLATTAFAQNHENEAIEEEKPSMARTFAEQMLAKSPRSIPTYPVSVSSPNRIAVNGSRIINIVYDQNQLEVELDKTSGEAFVIPISGNAITVFVMSENKETHSLTLIPQNILSQNIELNSQRPETTFSVRPMSPNPILKAGDFDTAMKNLMVSMARQELPEGFDLIEQEINLNEERSESKKNNVGHRLTLLRRYISASYVGEELRYTNLGKESIELAETFFTDKDVVAVAIVKHQLASGQSTRLFRIKKRSS